MITGNAIALTLQIFVSKVMALLLNRLSRFVIVYLPRSKHLNLTATVTICSDFGGQENKLSLFPFFSPSISCEGMEPDAMILIFQIFRFKSVISLSSFTSIKRLFSSSLLSAIKTKKESEVAQSCSTLCNPIDCSLPCSSTHGIFQARVLEWVPFPSPEDLPNPEIEPRSPAL